MRSAMPIFGQIGGRARSTGTGLAFPVGTARRRQDAGGQSSGTTAIIITNVVIKLVSSLKTHPYKGGQST